jgi:hypothetical protein
VDEVAIPSRTFLVRTAYGTAFYWDQRLGLLARDERTGRWHGLSPRRTAPWSPRGLVNLDPLRSPAPVRHLGAAASARQRS